MLRLDTNFFSENASVVAIGNFDGVHRGHQGIFKLAKEKTNAVPIIALSFWPHPMAFFRPNLDLKLLSTLEERTELMRPYADHLIALSFDQNLAEMSAKLFVENILIRDLKATHVLIGEDFKFGKNREGNAQALRNFGNGIFETIIVQPICDQKGTLISSTRIRNFIQEGKIQRANDLLGRPYFLQGKVIHGEGVGNGLGFPTANLSLDPDRLLPKAGIYATRVHLNENIYNGATYIGSKPTFHENGNLSVETFLSNFDDDIYGDNIRLEFIENIRDDQKFEGVEALVKQIAIDVKQCNEVLNR